MLLLFIMFFMVTAGALASEASNPATHIEIVPVWDGNFKLGKHTEITINLLSHIDQVVSLDISSSAMKTSLSVPLKAGAPYSASIPILASPNMPVTVKLTDQDGISTTLEKWLRPLISNSQFTITPISDTDKILQGHRLPNDYYVLQPHVTSLPYTRYGYEAVDILILDTTILAKMDEKQLQGLFGYLGNCGKVLTVGMNQQVFNRLKQGAGCNARFLRAIPYSNKADSDNIDEQIIQLSKYNPRSLPEKNELETIADIDTGRQSVFQAVIFLFVFYYILLIVSGATSRKSWPLYLVISFTTILMLFAWRDNTPSLSLVSWVEMNAGSQVGRFSSLLRVEGSGIGQYQTALPEEYGLSESSTEPGLQYIYPDFPRVKNPDIKVPFFLLSQNDLYFSGTTTATIPVELKINKNNLTVNNISHGMLNKGFLYWNRKWFMVPALKQGEQWSADIHTTANVDSIPPLLMRKTDNSAVASLFLQRDQDKPLIEGISHSESWMSIKIDSTEVVI